MTDALRQGHDRYMHIVAKVVRLDKTRGCPTSVGIRHRCGLDLVVTGDKRLWPVYTFYVFVFFSNPVKTDSVFGAIMR